MHPARYIIWALVLISVAAGTAWFLSKIRINDPAPRNEVPVFDYAGSPETVEYRRNGPDGKALYQNNCASCHNLFKRMAGPPLIDFAEKEPWTHKENIYRFIQKPELFRKKNTYVQALEKEYGGMKHMAFPLNRAEIDAIVAYTVLEYDRGVIID